MKKVMFMVLAVCLMTACEKALAPADDAATVPDGSVVGKKFTFTVKGDFTDDWKPVTRGYLSADGKDMTDLWVLDYMGGVLVQQLHQDDNTADDFGKPVMTKVNTIIYLFTPPFHPCRAAPLQARPCAAR